MVLGRESSSDFVREPVRPIQQLTSGQIGEKEGGSGVIDAKGIKEPAVVASRGTNWKPSASRLNRSSNSCSFCLDFNNRQARLLKIRSGHATASQAQTTAAQAQQSGGRGSAPRHPGLGQRSGNLKTALVAVDTKTKEDEKKIGSLQEIASRFRLTETSGFAERAFFRTVLQTATAAG